MIKTKIKANLALIIAIFFLISCQKEPNKVIIIGLDGAEWAVIDYLIAKGKLPAFEKAKKEGAWGYLKTLDPIFSSSIWTSIATGVKPDKHGIKSFTAYVEGSNRRVPVTSNMRNRKAIWNILSEAGKQSAIAGWWVTWPAEKIQGYILSDLAYPISKDSYVGWPYFSISADSNITARTYPEEALKELEKFIDIEATEKVLKEMGEAGIPFSQRNMIVFNKDKFYHQAGKYLWKKGVDLLAVYLEGVDMFSHWYWGEFQKYHFQKDIDFANIKEQEEKEAYSRGDILVRYYILADRYLSEYMMMADKRTILLLVSDHGFRNYDGKTSIHIGDNYYKPMEHWHSEEGVFIAWGKQVKPQRLEGISVLDITPTVLSLLDLPVANDMDGRVIDLTTKKLKIKYIDTYETGEKKIEEFPIESPETKERLETLKSLGYLEKIDHYRQSDLNLR